jgi:hypothetical protein
VAALHARRAGERRVRPDEGYTVAQGDTVILHCH